MASGDDRTPWVAEAKTSLEAEGVALAGVGPIGPVRIINRVALQHPDEHLYLLLKPTGPAAELPTGVRVSSDVLVYPDGAWVDCVVNAETQNGPSWQLHTADPSFRARLVPPVSEGLFGAPAPPSPPVPAPDDAVTRLAQRVAVLEGAVTGYRVALLDADARLRHIEDVFQDADHGSVLDAIARLRRRQDGLRVRVRVFGVSVVCQIERPE